MARKEEKEKELEENKKRTLLAREAAKRIVDKLTPIIEQELFAFKLNDIDLFQGAVCQLLSAFMLCHCIKILEKSGGSTMVPKMCEDTMRLAHDFSENCNYIEKEKH